MNGRMCSFQKCSFVLLLFAAQFGAANAESSTPASVSWLETLPGSIPVDQCSIKDHQKGNPKRIVAPAAAGGEGIDVTIEGHVVEVPFPFTGTEVPEKKCDYNTLVKLLEPLTDQHDEKSFRLEMAKVAEGVKYCSGKEAIPEVASKPDIQMLADMINIGYVMIEHRNNDESAYGPLTYCPGLSDIFLCVGLFYYEAVELRIKDGQAVPWSDLLSSDEHCELRLIDCIEVPFKETFLGKMHSAWRTLSEGPQGDCDLGIAGTCAAHMSLKLAKYQEMANFSGSSGLPKTSLEEYALCEARTNYQSCVNSATTRCVDSDIRTAVSYVQDLVDSEVSCTNYTAFGLKFYVKFGAEPVENITDILLFSSVLRIQLRPDGALELTFQMMAPDGNTFSNTFTLNYRENETDTEDLNLIGMKLKIISSDKIGWTMVSLGYTHNGTEPIFSFYINGKEIEAGEGKLSDFRIPNEYVKPNLADARIAMESGSVILKKAMFSCLEYHSGEMDEEFFTDPNIPECQKFYEDKSEADIVNCIPGNNAGLEAL